MLKDPGLAPDGRRKVEFAATRMPVLRAIERELEREQPLRGMRIGACLHVTSETANLCRTLIAGGAELALCASNPLSTKDDVAAAIHADLGAQVFAIHGCDRDTFYRQVEGVLATRPTLILDDGADLTATIHAHRPELLRAIVGGTEVTSTGALRARNMAREGELRYPMIALNDADTKHLFDNRYGTGQNTIDGILRATNVLLAGSVLVVVGYGWCGRGVALRARATRSRTVRPNAVEYLLDGKAVIVLAEGRLVGQACAEAHPAEVMDLSFSTQALAVEYLVSEGGFLEAGVHAVPAAISDRVARHKLRAVGVRWDDLTDRQLAYLSSWRSGT